MDFYKEYEEILSWYGVNFDKNDVERVLESEGYIADPWSETRAFISGIKTKED